MTKFEKNTNFKSKNSISFNVHFKVLGGGFKKLVSPLSTIVSNIKIH